MEGRKKGREGGRKEGAPFPSHLCTLQSVLCLVWCRYGPIRIALQRLPVEIRIHFSQLPESGLFHFTQIGLLLNLWSSFPNYCLSIHNFLKPLLSLEASHFLLLQMVLELRCLKIYLRAQRAGFVCGRVLRTKFRWSLQSYFPPTEYIKPISSAPP